MTSITYTEYPSAFSQLFSTSYLIIMLIFCIVIIAGIWKMYEKAGETGWKCLIPIYSSYIQAKIAVGNGWMFLIVLVPLIGWIFNIYLTFKLAQSFGKGFLFTLGLIFLPIIFYPILGFGIDEYYGPQ